MPRPSMAVVGPPGCGKTHNAERIKAHFGLRHVIEGDQLSVKDWPSEGHLILSNLGPKTFPYRLYEDVMREIEREEEEAEQRKNEVRVESSHDAADDDDDDDDDFDRLAPPKPPKRVAAKPEQQSAPAILKRAAQHMEDRAAARDQPGGERSMKRTVEAFNALTGHTLSERDGWMFMVVLKAARACTTPTGLGDDYEDLAAYAGLAGEAAQQGAPK